MGKPIMGACLKVAVGVLTVKIVTTGFIVAQEASAVDVEALKKQNAEQQQRLEKLSNELDQIKKLLAEKGISAPGKESGEKPSASSLSVALYGYVKLDAAYDSSRISVGNFARWVESEQIRRNDNEFNMTANETRLGLRVNGAPADDFRFGGVVEMDFYSGIGADNSPSPRLRLANVNLEWPNIGFGVLAGQAPDVISPLYPKTVNYSPAWWQGNIGFRRPQLRLTETVRPAPDLEFKLEVAATRTIASTLFTPMDFIGDPGSDAGYPTAQGRVSVTFPGIGKRPVTLGVSGHWGQVEHDLTNNNDKILFTSWSGNVDVSLPITSWLSIQGEAYIGSNLGAYVGGIGQGISVPLLKSIDDEGGWVAASLGPWKRWSFNVGYGIDHADRGDLAANPDPMKDPRASNQMYFGNVFYSLNSRIQLALELMHMRTTYKSVAAGDDWREQFAVIMKF
jgi:hypothetical protein